MTPTNLLLTATLLGLYVLCGGAYGTCYTLGQVQGWRLCARLTPGLYAFQVAIMLAVVFLTPLAFAWKALILVSTAAYAVIPAITLRYLRGLHAGEET